MKAQSHSSPGSDNPNRSLSLPASRSRFAEAGHKPPGLDKVDVVLGEWASGRPKADLAPIAVTIRVSRLAQVLQQRMERASSRFGLDWGQFLVLAALRGAGSPFRMSPRELHRLLLLSPAAVTNRLYRLEAKGFIERTADPTDGRSLPVILTAEGLSTIDRAMAACVEGERGLLAGVDEDDLETTVGTLRGLLAAYDEYPSRRRWQRESSTASDTLRAPPAPPGTTAQPPTPPIMIVAKPKFWPTSSADLERLQRKLARQADEADPWHWRGEGQPAIGGLFVSLPRNRLNDRARDIAWAAAVIMEGHNVIASATATRRLMNPYKPGYLALTVGPILEDVVSALSLPPDIILVNAAGRDHIRGAGLAIQLGAALGVPTVGVTERPDIGLGAEPDAHRGDWTPVRINHRLVGFRIRSMSSANSIMAHAAWMTTPETARDIVIRTTGRMRVPEPLQRARQLARKLRSEYERSAGTGLQDGIHG
ncbi:MAG: endonuclease V [Actinomycetota bacterium]|nr:endonuclease V [Actinomycetota bacterium]